MIVLDAIDLADCFSPEQLVSEIFRLNPGLPTPIPVEEIAHAVGISHILSIPTESLEGLLISNEGKSSGVIYYRESSPIGRQRFTIGHELGHFLLPHHGSSQSCTPNDIRIGSGSSTTKSLESEANMFSSLLLMPETRILTRINSTEPTMELLKSVAEDFVVSFEAMANKCTSLSETPLALVYSRNGKVRYCWKRFDKFPHFLLVKSGAPLPHNSHVMILKQTDETISPPLEINASVWLKAANNTVMPQTIIEQTYTQSNGYQVTMLKC